MGILRKVAATTAAAAFASTAMLATTSHAGPRTTERWVVSHEDRVSQIIERMKEVQETNPGKTLALSKALPYSCWVKTLRINMNLEEGKDLLFQGNVIYRICNELGSEKWWIIIDATVNSYNLAGTKTLCDWRGIFKGVSYNWYFWNPSTGENFNPRKRFIPCSPDTTNTNADDYTGKNLPARTMRITGKGPNYNVPLAKVWAKKHMGYTIPDEEETKAKRFPGRP